MTIDNPVPGREHQREKDTLGSLKEVELPFSGPDQNVETHYVLNNEGFFKRFSLPKIDQSNELKPNFPAVAKEYLAGLLPFVAIVPEDIQRRVQEALSKRFPSGYKIETEGVIIQQSYSALKIREIFGFDHYLSYPTVATHIYDENNEFVKKIEFNFIDKRTAKKIEAIKTKFEGLSDQEKKLFQEKLASLWSSYEQDGLTERLIENEKSVGMLGSLRGLSVIDLSLMILEHKSEANWLDQSYQGNETKFSREQHRILKKRKELYSNGENIEGEALLPTELEVLQKAVDILAMYGTDPSRLDSNLRPSSKEYLENLLVDLSQGFSHYHHNIARGGQMYSFWKKREPGEKYTFFDKLKLIASSKRLIPYKGTYIKGSYFQGIDFGSEEPISLLSLLYGERLKNNLTSPIIFDVVMKKMPTFKHQNGYVRYVDTQLPRSLRRVIIEKEQYIEQTQQILTEAGYQNIEVVTSAQFEAEVLLLQLARRELLREKGLVKTIPANPKP